MRKLVQVFALVFIVSFGLMYLVSYLNKAEGYSSGNVINVYNWGEYIDPDLIDKFEEETGIKVIYQTYDSNEAMMTKLGQGGTTFDIIVPSDYAIARMAELDMLQPLDHSKIPNLQYIDPRFLDLGFDPGNQYSIPYFWGTFGIIYNTKLLGGKELHSWNDLWDPDLRNEIFLVDGAREVIGLALNSLGYSLNDTNMEHLHEAKEKLDQLTPNIKAILGDEIKMLVANEEAAIAVTWSGEAADIMYENENINYVVPIEGSNLWFDNLAIPKTARNVEGAHKFINFMLDPENAAQNADYIGYPTPNKEALQYLDEEVVNDERFYPPPELTDKLEIYENLGKKMLAYYNELYLEFKMHRK